LGIQKFLAEHPQAARIQLLPGHKLGSPHQRNPAVDVSTCRKAENILCQTNSNVEACW
jgi:hypothetical protein